MYIFITFKTFISRWHKKETDFSHRHYAIIEIHTISLNNQSKQTGCFQNHYKMSSLFILFSCTHIKMSAFSIIDSHMHIELNIFYKHTGTLRWVFLLKGKEINLCLCILTDFWRRSFSSARKSIDFWFLNKYLRHF